MKKNKPIKSVIEYEGVRFELNGTALVKLLNDGEPVDVYIPSALPSGERIDSIGRNFCKGEFNTIDIDNKILNISEGAFISSNVEKVIWPSSCKTIPNRCFDGCSINYLENIDAVVRIEDEAFEYTFWLESLVWPSGCKTVPEKCFMGSNVKAIHNLKNVVSIGGSAFKGCKNLKELDLSQCLVFNVGVDAFSEIPSSEKIKPLPSSKFKVNGVYFETLGCSLIKMSCGLHCGEIELPSVTPEGVKISSIGNSFFGFGACCKIIIPPSVSMVQTNAFREADVKKVVWSSNCDEIPAFCFYHSSIENISNIDHVRSIGMLAFGGSSLKSITWPSKCELVPQFCFDVSKLREISNIDHVSIVQTYAFHGCSIKKIEWPSKCFEIPNGCFEDCRLEQITNIDHVKQIGVEAFSESNLKSIIWPSACNAIPKNCFKNSDIQKISNIGHVTSVAEKAFMESDIKEVEWPSNCNIIPSSCFENSNIEKISNIDNVVYIRPCAFKGSNIQSIAWPSNCKTIPEYCFDSSTIESISNIDHVTGIGLKAFAGSKIKKIVWPSNCIAISEACFKSSELEVITNISNVSVVYDNAFGDLHNSNKLDLSEMLCCSFGSWAFRGTSATKVILPYYMDEKEAELSFDVEG